MLKTIAVIQARINSKRLPGKVMLKICGKPVMWHIFHRLKQCSNLDQIVISTGPYNKNKEIHEFAKKFNISLYSGSENDVLDRIFNTAKAYDSDFVVRVTADCPFVDPKIIDRMVSFHHQNYKKYDIIVNNKPPTFPHGLDIEVSSFEILQKMWLQIKEPNLREWFPLFVEKNPEIFRIHNIPNTSNLSHLRWTIDYPEDFEFTEKVFEQLYSSDKIFLMEDILKLLKNLPELSLINSKYVGQHNVGAPKI
jgi:spore coat polysaccharide biosynthesis protein SpsF